MIADLDLDGPVKDPTQMSADELMGEMREVTKKLLGYGARAPKELMLFVKNMMFLNGATAILAPDLDMLQQMMSIYMYFARDARRAIMREVGIDASQFAAPDPDALKAAFLVDSERRDAHLPRPAGAPRRGPAQAATQSRAVAAGGCAARSGVRRACPSCRRCRRWPSGSTPRSPARCSRASSRSGSRR